MGWRTGRHRGRAVQCSVVESWCIRLPAGAVLLGSLPTQAPALYSLCYLSHCTFSPLQILKRQLRALLREPTTLEHYH